MILDFKTRLNDEAKEREEELFLLGDIIGHWPPFGRIEFKFSSNEIVRIIRSGWPQRRARFPW